MIGRRAFERYSCVGFSIYLTSQILEYLGLIFINCCLSVMLNDYLLAILFFTVVPIVVCVIWEVVLVSIYYLR